MVNKEETCVELEQLLRSYYKEYPFGHTICDAHNAYQRGAAMWRRIGELSNSLNDNHEYLQTVTKGLKEEGLFS